MPNTFSEILLRPQPQNPSLETFAALAAARQADLPASERLTRGISAVASPFLEALKQKKSTEEDVKNLTASGVITEPVARFAIKQIRSGNKDVAENLLKNLQPLKVLLVNENTGERDTVSFGDMYSKVIGYRESRQMPGLGPGGRPILQSDERTKLLSLFSQFSTNYALAITPEEKSRILVGMNDIADNLGFPRIKPPAPPE